MNLPAGTRVGSYEIQQPLGAGGMGEVYRARDTRLGRDVALKILPDAFAHDADRLARFEREAQILASLNHPNIAAIYGLEEAPSSTPGHAPLRALVLELVDGRTLADRIAHGPIPLEDALPIAKQIVEALEAAHAQGVVHRDLKPSNITLRVDGTVKVLDFGLARLVDPAAPGVVSPEVANSPTVTSPALTRLGTILGTAAYMAPEQARGRSADKRADVWAFGCVLFEMLTARRVFHGESVSDTIASVLRAEPDWTALPAETPQAIRRLLRRCLSKDVHGRLPDIGVARLEIAEALAPAEGSGVGHDAGARARGAAAHSHLGTRIAIGLLGALVLAGLPFVFSYVRQSNVAPVTVRFVVTPPPGTRFPTATTRSSLSVSPDGRLIAFRAHRVGELSALWIRTLDALEARELRGTEGATQPFWSPESRVIGFFADGKLKKVDAASGAVQIVCDAPSPAGGTWGPAGVIIFGSFGGGLFRVPAAGGAAVPLTTLDPARKETDHALPEFLPDGRRFLFTAQPGNLVFLGSLDSPERTRLIEADSNVQYAPPGYLVFSRQGTLMAQSFDESRGVLTGEPAPVAEQAQTVTMPSGGTFTLFSVSKSGVLAYESAVEEPGGSAVWVDRTGRELGPVNPALGSVEFPKLSPDGRRLAVIVGRDLWVDDLHGRPPIRLTFDGRSSRHYAPIWTRDGQRIVYETNAPSALRSLPADGSTSTPDVLSPVSHFHPFGWSPDGRALLAAEVGTTGTDIVAVTVGETNTPPRPVVETPGNDGGSGAAMSPDGRWLAYASNATGRQEIWVRRYPGPGAPVRVSPNGGDEPVWARNGRELFYLDGNRVMSVAVQPGDEFHYSPPVGLFEAAYMHSGQPPTYDVAPDGRFVMLKPAGEVPGTQPIAVVVNWIDDLTRRARTP